MINPADLQNNIVELLRSIPDLVSFVGDVAEIQAYDDESEVAGDPESAEFGMMGRSVLVVWAGAETPRMGETRGWKHTIRTYLKAESITAYYELAQLIIDGIPADPGCESFLNSVIHDDCDGVQDVEIVPVKGNDKLGRLLIQFAIYEK